MLFALDERIVNVHRVSREHLFWRPGIPLIVRIPCFPEHTFLMKGILFIFYIN